MMIVKFLYQLFQRKNLLITGRAPPKKGDIIYHSLRYKSLLDHILIG